MSTWYADGGKRALDILLSSVVLVVLSPLLVLVALAVWQYDRSSPIFRQRRTGRNGEPFVLLKFRSMSVGTRDVPSTDVGSLRITPVGRIIRRLNIDELPQLVNVLRGDMSIVGPRPPLPAQDELIRLRRENGAIAARPGLTGLAQVSAYDGMPVAAKAALDGEYVSRLGVWLDVVIMLRTVGYLFRRPPVY